MSDADLSGCRAKLARSKEKLDTLKTNVADFLEDHPYRVEYERPPGRFVARLRIERAPPTEWGLDAGEVASDTRAALDYLVFQLAIDNGADPTTSRTQFPIFLDEGEYRKGGGKSHRERMLEGVARPHRQMIDGYQPYQRGQQAAANDPLAILRSISDREKHRELHAVLAAMGTLTLKMPHAQGTFFARLRFHGPQPLTDGVILSDGKQPEWGGDVEVGEEPDFTVAFKGDRVVSIDDLERIVRYVSGIVDTFEGRITS
jgi:hypothetical protein